MYSSYALPFYDIVLLGFSVWNLSVFFFGWESDKNSHKDRSMAGGVQWRKSYSEGSDPNAANLSPKEHFRWSVMEYEHS